MKKILMILLPVPVLLLAMYLWGVARNNVDVAMPEDAVLQQHFKQSLFWLKKNKIHILSENNAMLWWMISEAARVSQDPQLNELLNEYKQTHASIKYSLWAPLLWPEQRSRIDAISLLNLPDYNQHFIYSLHCAQNLLDELAVIKKQNEAGFCFQASHIYRPACITHQLMGVNFQRNQQCSREAELKPLITSLQQDIVHQLSWDIRVIDVYLQRVMMLLITGAQQQVKPVWVQQILDHQLDDGGWGDFDPLVSVGSKSIGFSSRILALSSPRSSFHATAQGIYLLAILLEKD